MQSVPPDQEIVRFWRDFYAIFRPNDPERPVGICVSGGADSLALLLLAKAALPHVVAATVDHGLRPEAADEARFVADLCADRQIDHSILTIDSAPVGNVSDWARTQRYQALQQWGAEKGVSCLMTAHHADDQLETMVMRLNRSSGVGGLAAIRARNGNIVRPLLGWRKSELEGIVQTSGIKPVDDPSNRDDRYDRARIRKAIVGTDLLDPIAVSRSAAILAEADAALDWTVLHLADRAITTTKTGMAFTPTALPTELRRRMCVLCLRRLGAYPAPRGAAIDRLLAALSAGKTVTLAGIKCCGGADWKFSPAQPRRKN